MAQYNIIANSRLTTLTGIGEGNVELSYTQLTSLYDNNYTSTDIQLSPADNLYLEADFSYRIRLDAINLYLLSSVYNTDYVRFYYRNYTSNSYTQLTTAYNGSFYYAQGLPPNFAPVNVLVTVSGVDCYVSELEALNEDYSVGFGEDGDDTVVDIRDSEANNIPGPHILKIKNNSSADVVNAYACVDYTGDEADYFIKLSADDLRYYGILDGAHIKDDYISSNYRWSYGLLDNTQIVNREYIRLALDDANAIGMYTTPIISMEDQRYCNSSEVGNRYDSSFLITTYNTVSGVTSIKVDSTDNDFTMEIRSSNTEPLPYTKLFDLKFKYHSSKNYYFDLYETDLYTGQTKIVHTDLLFTADTEAVHFYVLDVAVDEKTGNILTTVNFSDSIYSYIYKNTKVANLLNYKFELLVPNVTFDNLKAYVNNKDLVEFTSTSVPWVLLGDVATLWALDDTLNSLIKITNVATMSPDLMLGSNMVWIIKNNEPGAHKVGIDGLTYFNIADPSIKLVAANYDGGCWVYEDSTHTINKYVIAVNDDNNEYMKKVVSHRFVETSDTYCRCVANDKTGKDGLWFVVNYVLYHIDATGKILSDTKLPVLVDSLKSSSLGVLARRQEDSLFVFVDLNGKIINSGAGFAPQAVKTFNFSQTIQTANHVLPLETDPVWGTNGSLGWKKAPISGYFLPKTKYHQARYTLRTTVSGQSPELTSVVIPKPVVLTDIHKGDTADLFIRTNFTGNEDPNYYATKIRAWWYIQAD